VNGKVKKKRGTHISLSTHALPVVLRALTAFSTSRKVTVGASTIFRGRITERDVSHREIDFYSDHAIGY